MLLAENLLNHMKVAATVPVAACMLSKLGLAHPLAAETSFYQPNGPYCVITDPALLLSRIVIDSWFVYDYCTLYVHCGLV